MKNRKVVEINIMAMVNRSWSDGGGSGSGNGGKCDIMWKFRNLFQCLFECVQRKRKRKEIKWLNTIDPIWHSSFSPRSCAYAMHAIPKRLRNNRRKKHTHTHNEKKSKNENIFSIFAIGLGRELKQTNKRKKKRNVRFVTWLNRYAGTLFDVLPFCRLDSPVDCYCCRSYYHLRTHLTYNYCCRARTACIGNWSSFCERERTSSTFHFLSLRILFFSSAASNSALTFVLYYFCLLTICSVFGVQCALFICLAIPLEMFIAFAFAFALVCLVILIFLRWFIAVCVNFSCFEVKQRQNAHGCSNFSMLPLLPMSSILFWIFICILCFLFWIN